MFKTIVIVLLVLVAAVLVYAATKPDTFRIERTVSINAPPEKLFAIINDLHNWDSWSPYRKLDPSMQKTLSGSASGKGAVYEWDGSRKVGAGRMEIVESSPPSQVTMKLDFLRPFEAHNIAEFILEPKGGATDVTWALHGPTPYVSKLMSVFISMDSMVGGAFEEGLGNLKSLAEK
jgi:uncharacterized protein YndB with AHSA1/START domain